MSGNISLFVPRTKRKETAKGARRPKLRQPLFRSEWRMIMLLNRFAISLYLLCLGLSAAGAQQVIGNGPNGPICNGPLGPGYCADVMNYLQQQQALGSLAPPHPTVLPMPQPGGFPGAGGGLPGAGLLPQDGQIVAAIAQQCGGNPACMAGAWGTVEVQRCRNGVGVPGGCFGPNGEIMRVINRVVPQNLQPNVLTNNVAHDIQHGPGPNNDLVGCNGAANKLFGGHC
jgi:hypothetical protein